MFGAVKRTSSLIQSRSYYGMRGPRREPMCKAESYAHGICIACGIFATPVWVLTHIKEYRGIA